MLLNYKKKHHQLKLLFKTTIIQKKSVRGPRLTKKKIKPRHPNIVLSISEHVCFVNQNEWDENKTVKLNELLSVYMYVCTPGAKNCRLLGLYGDDVDDTMCCIHPVVMVEALVLRPNESIVHPFPGKAHIEWPTQFGVTMWSLVVYI